MLCYVNKKKWQIYCLITHYMFAKFYVGDPKSDILKFEYCIFIQIIHFICYSKINVWLLLSDTIFLKKKNINVVVYLIVI